MDSVVTVGLKHPGQRRGVDDRGKPLMTRGTWNSIARRFEAWDIEIVYLDEVQPVTELKVSSAHHIKRLRRSPHVSYVEPGSEPSSLIQSSTCGPGPIKHPSTIDTYGDKLSYVLTRHDVPLAWSRSTGSGVDVAIIDSGISATQQQFQTGGVAPAFDAGQSAGRTLTLLAEWSEPGDPPGQEWNDTCGHGTKTASVLFAPREGVNVVGVAYGSNGVAIRGLGGVMFGLQQFRAVRRSIDRAGERAKIVSMSFGSIYHYDSIEDRIQYWYYPDPPQQPKEVLFIGAAGTFPQGVGSGSDGAVFPASIAEVVAVTGLDPDHLDVMKACEGCFRGPKVEFASYISGEAAYFGGGYGETDGVGGASAATPVVAGIAALVWSRYPNWSRDQVIDRLRESAALYYNKDSKIGYGPVNADAAVGGLKAVRAHGPDKVQSPRTYTFSVSAMGDGPFSYAWDSGETGTQITRYLTPPPSGSETLTVRVTVEDQISGEEITALKHVEVCYPGQCLSDGGPPPGGPFPGTGF